MSYVLDTTTLSALTRSEARPAARLLALRPDDVAIAADALAVDAVLVTDDVRHFVRVSRLRTESWS